MRSLLAAAVGVAAAAFPAGAAGPHPETLYSRPHSSIAAFAQDGALVAWFAPSRTSCNQVHVLSLANGIQDELPAQAGSRNVTCHWDVIPPVGLALAGTSVLWTLRESTPIQFDYLLGAAVEDPKERRFQEIAHTNLGAGLWLTGLAGDQSTLVYGVTTVDYVDEAGCLAGTATCELKIAGGGIYRVVGRQLPRLVPGTGAAVAVAASTGAVAYVPTGSIGKDGAPLPGGDVPIEIVDSASGRPISEALPAGIPIAIALAPHLLAALEQTPIGLRLAWYDRATGKAAGSAPVSAETSPELTANDQYVVYRVGRSIRAVQVATGRARSLVTAAATPVGLSLEGSRLAWAENLKAGARIRALYLTAKG